MMSTEAATRAAPAGGDPVVDDGPTGAAGAPTEPTDRPGAPAGVIDAAGGATAPAHLAGIAALVDDRLDRLFADEQARWGCIDADLRLPLSALAAFCRNGGKRLRPAFCYWAFVGAGGGADDQRLADACAALELLHAFALIHDDVMDGSTTRRNHETVHIRFAGLHRDGEWRGEARRFGEGVAVLLGDLAFVYADQLMERMAPEVARLYTELRLELTMGQYLDLLGAARGEVDEVVARRIAWYKSAKYTVERPAPPGRRPGRPPGRAGRAAVGRGPAPGRGLPAARRPARRVRRSGGDRQAGGRRPAGGQADAAVGAGHGAHPPGRPGGSPPPSSARVGDPELAAADIDDIRSVLESSGARAEVEARIERLATESTRALRRVPLCTDARVALGELATYVAARRA